MEALDNPSYFTVPGGSKFSLLKRRGMGTASSHMSFSQPTTPTGPNTSATQRRSHRALLRSLSAQNDSSLLVLGNPRLCDLAPQHRPQARRRTSSSASDIVPLSPSSLEDDGEVFLSNNGDARYYNLGSSSATLPPTGGGRRRHSIGAFLRPAPLRTDEAAHSIRKRCERCSEKGNKSTDVLDIVFLSSGETAAAAWVNYLQTCFQQVRKEQSKPPFKLECIKVEDMLTGMTAFIQNERLSKAHLQIVIVCPEFLKKISEQPGPASILGTLLHPARVLAMLLGVTDDMVNVQHRTALFCFDQWRRRIVKDKDPTFVGDFLGEAMDFLSRPWQLQQAINQIHKDENRAEFSLLPKKIKVGQNKLIVLLTDPLKADDTLQINVDKNGQRLEVKSIKRRNPYTLQFSMPATCLQVSMLVSVTIEKNGRTLGHRRVKCESKMGELDQILRSSDNPLQFMCQTLGLSPGDKDQLDIFLTAAMQRNIPPHFNILQPAGHRCHSSGEEYPTLLHFSARFGLEKLSWQLLECPGGEQACQLRNTCQLTPADMAERAGHTRLANALKGYLQMTELSSMYSYLKGISEKQPSGFNEANYLLPRPLNDTYLIPPTARPLTSPSSPSATTSQPSTPQYTNLDSYQIPPSPVSLVETLDYHIPPLPLPLQSIFGNYQVPGHAAPYLPPTPPTPSSPVDRSPQDAYLEMNSASGTGSANNLRQNLSLKLTQNYYQNCKVDNTMDQSPITENVISSQNSFDVKTSFLYKGSESHRMSSSSSNASTSGKLSVHGAQDELVEIINDFKNNVFTITEVEKLVENWQNRHDVQQSFKEKQEQLSQMRDEYERIQRNMKEELKRATPFERIRKFFSRKSKSAGCNEECKLKESSQQVTQSGSVCHRPASSLSLHSSCSSSSSGRMSTGSGTSLGDSGTHSDPEDRKFNEIARHELKNKMSAGKLYYEIPQFSSPKCPEERVHLTEDLLEYVVPGFEQSKTHPFISRSNSLSQEDTIIEVEEPPKTCSVDVHLEERNALPESNEEENIQSNQEIAVVEVHIPPQDESDVKQLEENMNSESKIICEESLVKSDTTVDETDKEKNTILPTFTTSNCDLHIIEESSELNQHNFSFGECKSKLNENTTELAFLEKSERFLETMASALNNNVIEECSEGQSNIEDDREILCENILEQTDTEVLFDLPDYVNLTVQPPPPVPPRSQCSHITL